MKPLQAIAMGFVFVVLEAKWPALGGYDAYFDPFGWLLILYGVRGLPDGLPFRATVRALGVWSRGSSRCRSRCPQVVDWLEDVEPALAWAAYLPQFGSSACSSTRSPLAAIDAGEPKPARWLRDRGHRNPGRDGRADPGLRRGVHRPGGPGELIRFLVYVLAGLAALRLTEPSLGRRPSRRRVDRSAEAGVRARRSAGSHPVRRARATRRPAVPRHRPGARPDRPGASVPLSVPQVVDWLDDGEPALAWAAYLPQFAFVGLLFHAWRWPRSRR